MEDEESLQAVRLLRNFPHGIHHSWQDFTADGAEAAGEVVSGVFLRVDHQIRMEQISPLAVANLVNHSRLALRKKRRNEKFFIAENFRELTCRPEWLAARIFLIATRRRTCGSCCRRLHSCRCPDNRPC